MREGSSQIILDGQYGVPGYLCRKLTGTVSYYREYLIHVKILGTPYAQNSRINKHTIVALRPDARYVTAQMMMERKVVATYI